MEDEKCKPGCVHEQMIAELQILAARYEDKMKPMELLGVLCNHVGRVCSKQDERLIDNGAVELAVLTAIEYGSMQAAEELEPDGKVH